MKWSITKPWSNFWVKYLENLIFGKDFKSKTYNTDDKLFELSECYNKMHCVIDDISELEDLIHYRGYLDNSMVYALRRNDGHTFFTKTGWDYIMSQLPMNMQLHELIVVHNKIVMFFARQYDGTRFIDYEYNEAIHSHPFGTLRDPLTNKQINIIEYAIKEFNKGLVFINDVDDKARVADSVTGFIPEDDKASVSPTKYGEWVLRNKFQEMFADKITYIHICNMDDYGYIKFEVETENGDSQIIDNYEYQFMVDAYENKSY